MAENYNKMIKYPTKKQIRQIADLYEEKLIADFLGSGVKANISECKSDFEEGVKDVIKLIKKLNK